MSGKAKTCDLVFEIGCEEIPHDLLGGGIDELKEKLSGALADSLLCPESITCHGTPRRLVAVVRRLPETQPTVEETVTGPPEKAGKDKDGNWTKAAEGFAKKQGVKSADLFVEETDRGPYLAVKKTVGGAPAADILTGLLPAVLVDIHWAKAMRWGAGQGPFVRPIRWICAVLNGKPLSFEFAGVPAGGISYGHRFMDPGPFSVAGPDDYLNKVRAAKVLVDMAERVSVVEAQLAEAGKKVGGAVISDPELVENTSKKTEWPVAVTGRFEEKYLEVPREVLITSMREHQDDFAIEDKNGKLLPAFVNFADNEATDLSVIARGNERVLRARLDDARFFFTEDQKQPLADYASRLESFMFQKELGSMADKAARVTALAKELAPKLGADPDHAARAASLSKCDLVTNMVYEFPELQGEMGGIYARKSGEPEAVATAIAEHYLPESAMGDLPQTPEGRAVAIADKLDTICGIYGVGLIPSGSQDPYALRRAGAGVVRMLMEAPTGVDLSTLPDLAVKQLAGALPSGGEGLAGKVFMFLQDRLEFALEQEGLRKDVVRATVNADTADAHDTASRARALDALTGEPGFDDLMTGCKRIFKIIPGDFSSGPVRSSDFSETAEKALWDAYVKANDTIRNKSLPAAERLDSLAGLRPRIDKYFDDVMVMAEDESVRTNRLSMLAEMRITFRTFADFSQVAVA